MPDNTRLPLVTDSVALDQISFYTYQAMLEIQQQRPQWLKEKYRKVAWQEERNQSIFLDRLKAQVRSISEPEKQLIQVRRFLQLILEPVFFESEQFKLFMRHLRQMNQRENPTNEQRHMGNSQPEPANSSKAIAILLLDAENLHLDVETEKFLDKICTYPIQIKVAFANWRSLGKKDVELHERHYELIHVPPGKDSADLKMSTVGSSIFVHYPTAKEVLVCSSDTALTHLCTTLQTHGLTVYRVRQHGEMLTVFNTKTGKTQTHSLKPIPQIPSIEEFIAQLKQLIKAEQERTGNHWIKLSRLSNLFQNKYQMTISQVALFHFPAKKSRDIFLDYPSDFVVHQASENAQIYITTFDINQVKLNDKGDKIDSTSKKKEVNISIINSQADLEQALVNILNKLTKSAPERYIQISILGSAFHKKYGQTISKTLDRLQLNGNFPKFIQSCQSLKLGQTEKGWQVAIAKET